MIIFSPDLYDLGVEFYILTTLGFTLLWLLQQTKTKGGLSKNLPIMSAE